MEIQRKMQIFNIKTLSKEEGWRSQTGLEAVQVPRDGGDHHKILPQKESAWILRTNALGPPGLNDKNDMSFYHEQGFDPRQQLEDYFSGKEEMAFSFDALKFPIENLIKTFTEGHIKGDVMIDFCTGPLVHHLYAASNFFKHIIVLKFTDRCIMELKRWLDSRTGAFDWEHAAKLHVELGGSSENFQDKDLKVRSAIQHVMKCNFEKENVTDPIVLPPADCIITAWLLGIISKDHDDYRRYLRKLSGLLKPGGHLIICGCLGTTYYLVGKDKFRAFPYDEDFIRKALAGEGFVIDKCVINERKAVSDLTDYKSLIFIAAHKEK
ncbi:indolethylamine N-methyltransferase-like [Hyla sarda]|uniref:indolethylamine N-methyltransferase-like n=1 Tax=Hyla sarda TaxID=327740 RepID=UPI0024C41FF5|nr:indolethylamine N-methyltransferase-like [Hyla sarda]